MKVSMARSTLVPPGPCVLLTHGGNRSLGVIALPLIPPLQGRGGMRGKGVVMLVVVGGWVVGGRGGGRAVVM